MTPQNMVRDFLLAAGEERPNKPIIPNERTISIWKKLLKEEVIELNKAFRERNIIEIAEAIADIILVTYSIAYICGIDIQPILEEVHKSNMTKFNNSKFKRRRGGKIMKSVYYVPPNIADEIYKQVKEETK